MENIEIDWSNYVAPDYTTTLRDKVVDLNTENFVYQVDFFGVPRPSIIWHHNGLFIQSDENFTIETGEYTSKLTIKKVFKEDQGVYRATIFSFMGEAISIAELKVNTGTATGKVTSGGGKIIKNVIKIKKAIKSEEKNVSEEDAKQIIKLTKGIQLEKEESTFESPEKYFAQCEKELKQREEEKSKKIIIKRKVGKVVC